MPDRRLARARLLAQGLAVRRWATPTQAVAAFGVMQGQDLTGVIASAALRSSGGAGEVIDALTSGTLVRGYPMRGTVFLAPAADLRWITELCAGPSLRDAARRRERHHDFTAADIERVFEAVAGDIGAAGISRIRFQEILRELGIDPSGGRAYHILFTLVADGRLCHGPFNGVDQQIMLASSVLGPGLADAFGGDEDAAIAELASRYFATHGPASVRDFAWWTKLPLTRIRRAVSLLAEEIALLGEETFAHADILERTSAQGNGGAGPLLLPGFDEFILGYRDRLFAMDAATHDALVPGNNGVFKKSVVVDGVVRGFWTREGAVGRRRLVVTEIGGVPKSAWPGIRRRFADYPFVTA